MGEVLPAEWTGLKRRQRDVLLALASIGPTSGATLHRAVTDSEGNAHTYVALGELRRKGLVETIGTNDGRESENRLTDDGEQLLADLRAVVCNE